MLFRASWIHGLKSRHATSFLRLALAATAVPAAALDNVYLTDVPDYEWHMGCFGTACGNLIGFWDRHGFANYYTGPTAGGVAPLTSFGPNSGIFSLWASQAGIDGRPASLPGHADDYYIDYESTTRDPYLTAGRPEHTPDCIGDFIGLNQWKWNDLAGECRGNIDGFSFNFFDHTGRRRGNFTPTNAAGAAIPDIQSGLRAFSASRGYPADSFSQLTDFNPDRTIGNEGFGFQDIKAEIDAGYPVLLFMQRFGSFSRSVGGLSAVNPEIHGMLAYGYLITDAGEAFVRYRTSWATGDREFSPWTEASWTPEQSLFLPVRGVIGFHPRPRLTEVRIADGTVHLRWAGPQATLHDDVTGVNRPAHQYVVERSSSPDGSPWEAVTEPRNALNADVPLCCDGPSFFRLRLVTGQ